MKKIIVLVITVLITAAFCSCNKEYRNDGSDYRSPGFGQKTEAVTHAPVTPEELSVFEREMMKNVFGDGYDFIGYEKMSDSDRERISEFFKTYEEGNYEIGFENGFFYTYNDAEGRKTYSIPWGYEALSSRLPDPGFKTVIETSFSESDGFRAEYSAVMSSQAEEYTEKIKLNGFELSYEEKNGDEIKVYDDSIINCEYTDKDGYIANIIYEDGVFVINLRAPAVAG